MPSSAWIHLIGLIVLMRQPAADGTIEALVPRVLRQTRVEPHIAMIVFEKNALKSHSGWIPQDLNLASVNATARQIANADVQFQYVVLDGVDIQVTSPSTRKRPVKISQSTAARRATQTVNAPGVINLTDFGLPNMTDVCLGSVIRPEFRRGGMHSAATISIPAGIVSACVANGHGGRVDARIPISNDGTVVITGTKRSGQAERLAGSIPRTLTFAGDAVIYLVNAPTKILDGNFTDAEPPHSLVYDFMLQKPPACITRRATSAAPECNPPLKVAGAGGSKKTDPLQPMMSTLHCSNTQFP